jgi:hypothetical protein
MKKIHLYALVFGLAVFLALFSKVPFVSSTAKGEPQTLKSSPTSAFDHDKHKVLIEKEGFNCMGCHPFNATLKTQHEKLGDEIEARYLKPGEETCHYCHNSQEYKATKPLRCLSCHKDNMAAILPKTHTLSYKKDHRILAQASGEECMLCHAQSFCVDCHMRRDTMQNRVHDGNNLFYPAVEARANPMKCSSCHRQRFCLGCHSQLLRR